MSEAQVRQSLGSAFGNLEFVFTCKGVRREDGRTAAEVEAALAQEKDGCKCL
jgi:hypothetical protein